MINTNKKVVLITMLPGLGKSYLHDNITGFVDYEEWIENKGFKYKDRKRAIVLEDLKEIILETECSKNNYLFITSSIAWEHFEVKGPVTSLYVFMNRGHYGCVEVSIRQRDDLCEKYGHELMVWNNDYEKIIKVNKNPNYAYILKSGEHVDPGILNDFDFSDSLYVYE